jgi:hypothetical protein
MAFLLEVAAAITLLALPALLEPDRSGGATS